MTKSGGGMGCRWCGASLAERPGPGRPKRFCRAACRQAAYRARQLAAGHGLSDGEVVVQQQALDDLGDAQYVLATALDDLELDLADARSRKDVERAVADLVAACGPLANLRIRPVAER